MDFNMDEQDAASAVALLQGDGKRGHEDWPDMAAGFSVKRARVAEHDIAPQNMEVVDVAMDAEPAEESEDGSLMNPAPFFYYNDRSTEKDPDPLLPLTLPGRVPNFPAKMHSILSRDDLADIICWMPHGRAWRVLKPREFEVRVLPTYFEHAKFSSFIRQANGWGFRRVTQGRDRNAYYHEMFLRGLPHLCKTMKRPGVSKKPASDPDHEPDLYRISELHPLPEKAKEDVLMHDCTLQGGPKARMPIYSGNVLSTSTSTFARNASSLTPRDQHALSAFEQSLGAAESSGNLQPAPAVPTAIGIPATSFAAPAAMPVGFPLNFAAFGTEKQSPLAAANELAAAFQASQAASQFAAGFAAAAALSQHQFKTLLDSFAAAQPNPEQQAPNQMP